MVRVLELSDGRPLKVGSIAFVGSKAYVYTWGELLECLRNTRFQTPLVEFYIITKALTPDHVDQDNIMFYFLFSSEDSYDDKVLVIVEFKHLEHFDYPSVVSWLAIMNAFSESVDADPETLSVCEANANAEYLIISGETSNPSLIEKVVRYALIRNTARSLNQAVDTHIEERVGYKGEASTQQPE